jgi:hypothetical protein
MDKVRAFITQCTHDEDDGSILDEITLEAFVNNPL